LLGDPGAGGVGGDTSELDSSGVQVDEAQHLQPLQEHGVHGEEVTGHDAGCRPAQERPPRGGSRSRRRLETVGAQDPGDGACGNPALCWTPAKLTVNQYLDRWLAHVRTTRRARTVARYTALLRDYVRSSIGARPLKQLTPLEVQAIYDRLAVSGRRDGKRGGLAPQHILAVHRCLHRALAQAVSWRLIAHNPASHATPPSVPRTEVVALAPEQVAVLLDAADRTSSPWLGDLDGSRSGDRGPQRRAVRPGMVRPRPRRRHHPVPPGTRHHRPHSPLGRRRWRRWRWVGWQPQGVGGRAAQVHCQQRHPHPATVRGPGAAPSPPPAAPSPPDPRPGPHPLAALGGTRSATPPGRAGPSLPH